MNVSYIRKILVIIFICISCNNSNDNQRIIKNDEIVLEIDELISGEPIYLSELFTDFHIIPLETDTNCFFYVISNIKLIGDTLFILDRLATKSVYIFSKEGFLVDKVSKIGRGPGEYTHLSDFDIDNIGKSIYIFDWPSKKINIYDFKGNFTKNVKINERFSSFIVSESGFYFYRPHPNTTSGKDNYLLYYYNKKGKPIWGKFNYTDTLNVPLRTEFFQGGNFFNSKYDIKFFLNFGTVIYSINGNSIKPFLILRSEKYKMSKKDFEILNQDRPSLYIKALGSLEKLTKISGYSENNELAFLKFYIGLKEYKMFYYFESGKVICSSSYVDDLTFINPSLFKVNNNQFIAYIDPSQINKFKEVVSKGFVKLDNNIKEKILSSSEYSNPIIILFDVKKN